MAHDDGLLHGIPLGQEVYRWTSIGEQGTGVRNIALADINGNGNQEVLSVSNGEYLDIESNTYNDSPLLTIYSRGR